MVGGGEWERVLRNGFSNGREFELQALGFERADDAEANSAGEQAAAGLMKVNRRAVDWRSSSSRRATTPKTGAKCARRAVRRRSVSAVEGKDCSAATMKDFPMRRLPRLATWLERKVVAELVEFLEAGGRGVGIQNEGERGARVSCCRLARA